MQTSINPREYKISLPKKKKMSSQISFNFGKLGKKDKNIFARIRSGSSTFQSSCKSTAFAARILAKLELYVIRLLLVQKLLNI